MRGLWTGVLLVGLPAWAPPTTQWVLASSTLTYHVSHPLHHLEGVSHAARGKGVCQAGVCEFLIAVPVRSFDSGDSNRDLHMLQVVRGGDFPMVTVRTRVPDAAPADTIYADLEISFAGRTAEYRRVPLRLETQGDATHLSGTIPATLSDFQIPPPALLTIPVQNEIPVSLDMVWRKQA